MTKLTDKKDVTKLILLFTLTYMVSYITRINYGTIIVEIEKSTGLSKTMLSMALTGSFITYGAGQIVSGLLGDKFSPKKLVSIGFMITVLMNTMVPLCQNPYTITALWCINGFAQSLMWPPLVRLMTSLLSEDDYNRASVRVSWGSSFGTIFVYFLSPVLISVSGWKSVFFVSAAAGVIMLFVWNKFSYDIPPVKKEITSSDSISLKKGRIFTPVMLMVMLAIILQGMLRDGVTTWMPSYISETFNLGSAISILTGVVLPLFSILSFQVASKLYRKTFTNPVLCAGVIFGFGAVSAFALYGLSEFSPVVSVALSALLTGSMHGVNLVLICMIPSFFKKYGNVSTVSGVINSCTYIGSALSTYGIALLSDMHGWNFTLLVWSVIALSGTLVCLVNAKPWKKRYQSGNDN